MVQQWTYQIDEDVVEVVTTEIVAAHGVYDPAVGSRHVHQRGVEGAAAQVEDEYLGTPGVEGTGLAQGVLQAGCRWLVDDAHDLHARLAECLEGHESLPGVGMSRYTDDSTQVVHARRLAYLVDHERQVVGEYLHDGEQP